MSAGRGGRDFPAIYDRRKARAAEAGTTVHGQRVARGEALGLSPSQASGHARADERPVSELHGDPRYRYSFLAEPGEVVTVYGTRAEMSRAAKANALRQQLRTGRISPGEYRRKTGRMRPIAGRRVLSDPKRALVHSILTDPEEWIFDSPRAGGKTRRR